MQEEELKNKKRENSLHLIMFSDSSRTVNLELKRWHLWSLATLASVLIIFSATSVYFVFKSVGFYDSTVAKTKELKNAIAQYQIKYEGLYEQAYEGQQTKQPNLVKKMRKPLPVAEKKVQPAPADTPAKGEEEVMVKLAAKEPPSTDEFLVEYTVESLKDKSSELFLKLKVANKDRSEKRHGYIAVVSAFKHNDGTYSYTAWPDRVEVDQATGKVKDMNNANRYEVRAFKFETINFPKPLTSEGKFEKVMIILSEKGKGVREYAVEVK